jgi:outer membrane lipoprotein-sorting protein
MFRNYIIFLLLAFSLFSVIRAAYPSERPEGDRVFGVFQKVESALKGMGDYTCEVEQIFYENGEEDRHYRLKFYFKRKKKIRIDFSYPYSSLTLLYHDGDKEATVIPLRFMPSVKFRLSIDNPMIKTFAGQRIDQTDMEYFVDFMWKNLKRVKQGEDELYEDGEQVTFLFWAKDYVEEKSDEKYRISISKKYWLPVRIERYNLEDKLLEKSEFTNYTINTKLKDRLFNP